MTFGAYLILPNVFILLVAFLSGTSLIELVSAMKATDPDPSFQWMLLTVQVLASATSFILVPILFIKSIELNSVKKYFSIDHYSFNSLGLLFATTICVITVNSVFIEWNMNLVFPEPLQAYLMEMEKELEQATNFLTDFKSFPYFLMAFIAIAIIPAVGEELLFRGLIQKYTTQIFKNPHIAIWVTAFIFGAIHMQFFGLVPRTILGAFFGYMVYFSGSLWYGIAAHFLNNGLTVLVLYLHQQNLVDFDIENTDSFSWETVGIFAIVGIVLFILFTKQFKKQTI